MPFPNLGMILMDEEHELSYKSETSPKYHARETAQKLAELSDATLVLGYQRLRWKLTAVLRMVTIIFIN